MQVLGDCDRLTEWNSYRAKLIEQATNRRFIAVAFRGSASIYGVQRVIGDIGSRARSGKRGGQNDGR